MRRASKSNNENALQRKEVTGMDYFKKIREIVADQLSIDAETITLATSFNDLDADSLDVVEVIMALEDEFGIAIPDEVAEKMKDIGAVVDYVSENAK